MSTHDEVLDAIDQTLSDYEVSGDAMRWTPEPATPPPNLAEFVQRLNQGFEQVGKAFARMVEAINTWAPRIAELKRQLEAAEAAERRSIRWSEYHRRQKRRNR